MKPEISDQDLKLVDELSQKVVGHSCHDRINLVALKVLERASLLDMRDIPTYLSFALDHKKEFFQLISALTIHTTSWFREKIQLDHVSEFVQNLAETSRGVINLEIWSTACSSGEECYSLAMLLESIRRTHPSLEYFIRGSDVDPVSLERAKKAVYRLDDFNQFREQYASYIIEGSGRAAGLFTLDEDIRSRVSFDIFNLSAFEPEQCPNYDIVLCRNLLLYFDGESASKLVNKLVACVKSNGFFLSGLSEPVEHPRLRVLNHCVYQRICEYQKGHHNILVHCGADLSEKLTNALKSLRVNFVRVIDNKDLERNLHKYEYAVICIEQSWILENPGLSRKVFHLGNIHAIPIIIFFAESRQKDILIARNLFQINLSEYCSKEKLETSPHFFRQLVSEIIHKNQGKLSERPPVQTGVIRSKSRKVFSPDLIVVGASTGGTVALMKLLKNIGLTYPPPIIVIQHISVYFAKAFAERLAVNASLNLAKMENNTALERGFLYMALDDYHIGLKCREDKICLNLTGKINSPSWPSIDYLFGKASETGKNIMALLLTGMGDDGVKNMKHIREAGGYTMAQSRESCTIFGMPAAAIRHNACEFVGDLEELRKEMDRCITHQRL